MRPNRLKQLWREGKPALGVWVSTGDPYVVESLGRAGFDWVLIDMQHGMGIDVGRAVACLQALSGAEAVALVRLPWNQPEYFQWVLDAGAQGVLVPLVNTPEDARRAVQACRYPPLGNRSFGPNRARLYGPDYFERANDEVALLVQVETREAVEQAEAIARVEGVDALYIGPADLAISMGLPPGLDVQEGAGRSPPTRPPPGHNTQKAGAESFGLPKQGRRSGLGRVSQQAKPEPVPAGALGLRCLYRRPDRIPAGEQVGPGQPAGAPEQGDGQGQPVRARNRFVLGQALSQHAQAGPVIDHGNEPPLGRKAPRPLNPAVLDRGFGRPADQAQQVPDQHPPGPNAGRK